LAREKGRRTSLPELGEKRERDSSPLFAKTTAATPDEPQNDFHKKDLDM